MPTPLPRAASDAGSVDKRGEASRLLRYASQSPIPLTGSTAQTIYGVFELHEAHKTGEKVNAWVDTVGGTASMLNDASMVAMVAHFALPPGLTSVAGPLNGATTIVYGVLDAGRDFYNGKTTGTKSDYVAGGAKLAASAVSAAGAFTMNMPLFYAGNAMYLGAIAGQNWDSVKAAWDGVTHPVRGAEAAGHWIAARFRHSPEHSAPASAPPSTTARP